MKAQILPQANVLESKTLASSLIYKQNKWTAEWYKSSQPWRRYTEKNLVSELGTIDITVDLRANKCTMCVDRTRAAPSLTRQYTIPIMLWLLFERRLPYILSLWWEVSSCVCTHRWMFRVWHPSLYFDGLGTQPNLDILVVWFQDFEMWKHEDQAGGMARQNSLWRNKHIGFCLFVFFWDNHRFLDLSLLMLSILSTFEFL